MTRITAYLKPHKLEAVKTAVSNLGISGMTVSDVRGCGNSPEASAWFAGEEHVIALPIRSKLMIVAPDDLKEELVSTIIRFAHTGEPNDGKITVEHVLDAVRIRTEESGETAI